MTCEMCSATEARLATLYEERVGLCAVCAADLGVQREEPPRPPSYSISRLFSVVTEALPGHFFSRLPDVVDIERRAEPLLCGWRVVATVLRPDGSKRGDIGIAVSERDVRLARSHAELFHLLVGRLETAHADLISKGL